MARNWWENRDEALNEAASIRGIAPTISGAGEVPYGDLAGKLNEFMTKQAALPFSSNLPDYQKMLEESSGNILSNLRGQIPPDVLRMLQQQAAERGVHGGMPGSPNVDASYLQALGLTSLDLQRQGEKDFSGAVERTPVPQLFNPASIFVPEMMGREELFAAMMGGGNYRPPGGTTITGAGPLGRGDPSFGRTSTTQVNPSSGMYAPPFQSPGQQNNTMWVNGQLMTDDQIQRIANGDLDNNYRPTDPYSPPPSGTWYNADDDTSNAPDRFAEYFQ